MTKKQFVSTLIGMGVGIFLVLLLGFLLVLIAFLHNQYGVLGVVGLFAVGVIGLFGYAGYIDGEDE